VTTEAKYCEMWLSESSKNKHCPKLSNIVMDPIEAVPAVTYIYASRMRSRSRVPTAFSTGRGSEQA